MIKGIHGLFYSSQTDECRAFLRDKLKLPFTDTGGGWLIFDFAEGDLGVHPTEEHSASGLHNISFFTDDIEGTVAELKGRGVDFDHDVQDHGYGLVTHFTMPGGVRVQLYEPKYAKKKKARPPAPRPKKSTKTRGAKSSRKKRSVPKAAKPRPARKRQKGRRRN